MRWSRALKLAHDHRSRALALTFFAVLVGGIALARLGGEAGRPVSPLLSPHPLSDPAAHAAAQRSREVEQRFSQGVMMLHAKQYEHAVTAFHRVLELAPELPEAHVNMGFALIGLERHAAARDFFESAIALRRGQVNAYYGLAVALEGMRDMSGAIGAMRSFLHLSSPDDPYRRKAQAALWEWEAVRADAQAAAPPRAGDKARKKENADANGR